MMFAELDEDGDGVISREEMKAVFEQYNLNGINMDENEFEDTFEGMSGGKDFIDFEQFKKHIFGNHIVGLICSLNPNTAANGTY